MESLLDQQILRKVANILFIFKGINCSRVLQYLIEVNEASVMNIGKNIVMDQPSVSRALIDLKKCQIVSSKKVGLFMVYTLNKSRLELIKNNLIKISEL